MITSLYVVYVCFSYDYKDSFKVQLPLLRVSVLSSCSVVNAEYCNLRNL